MIIKIRKRAGETSLSIKMNGQQESADMAPFLADVMQQSPGSLDTTKLAEHLKERGYQIVSSTSKTIVLEKPTLQ